jgi:hypothetical protein
MSSREDIGQALEKSLRSLIDSISSMEIDQHNRDLLNEFVENRECAVALEWLDALVWKRSIRISPEQEREFERLALLMGVDFSESRGEKPGRIGPKA